MRYYKMHQSSVRLRSYVKARKLLSCRCLNSLLYDTPVAAQSPLKARFKIRIKKSRMINPLDVEDVSEPRSCLRYHIVHTVLPQGLEGCMFQSPNNWFSQECSLFIIPLTIYYMLLLTIIIHTRSNNTTAYSV